MDVLLSGAGEYSSAYLDDLVVFSSSWPEQLEHLRAVLQYVRTFFGILQNLYNFLEASPHQHAKLESVIKEVNFKPRIMSVKKLSDTRWACRSDGVPENFSPILKALDEIEQSARDGRVIAEARGLGYQLLKFEFLLCLIVLKDLLFKCWCISDYLQREDIDIVSALEVADTTIKTLKEMRKETTFYDEASKMATDMGVEVSEPRPRKISHCLDDNWQNEHVIVTNEEKLRDEKLVYYSIYKC